jgi:hypothetical protein
MIDFSDNALSAALAEFLQARDHLNQIKELRRLHANMLRVNANQQDSVTTLMVEEVNEVAPLPNDYEPVDPVDAGDDD